MTKKQIACGVIILFVIASGVFAFWACSAIKSFLAQDEFFGPAENFVTKVDSPLSLEQARQDLKFPLPDEASDIYYAHYHQMISYMFMVKFSAPIEICKSHAIDTIQRFNGNNPDRQINLEFSAITEPLSSAESNPILNVTWFDAHNIKNGLMIGVMGAMQPMIWIDTDRNLFYYEIMD